MVDDEQINQAIANPPLDTRAWARSKVMRVLPTQKSRYVIDWDSVYVDEDKYFNIDDPFLTYEREAEQFIRECQGKTDDSSAGRDTGAMDLTEAGEARRDGAGLLEDPDRDKGVDEEKKD